MFPPKHGGILTKGPILYSATEWILVGAQRLVKHVGTSINVGTEVLHLVRREFLHGPDESPSIAAVFQNEEGPPQFVFRDLVDLQVPESSPKRCDLFVKILLQIRLYLCKEFRNRTKEKQLKTRHKPLLFQ